MRAPEDSYRLWKEIVFLLGALVSSAILGSCSGPVADNNTIRQAIVQEVLAREAVEVLVIRLQPGEARGEVENG